ncbi:MAG TPA: hypothetical protein VF395_02970 [Polyangiaceae bacterium]
MILVREILFEKTERRRGHGAVLDERENGWEPPSQPGRLDPAARFVLAEVQGFYAVREQ